jgi:putative phosphoribosyl transferase
LRLVAWFPPLLRDRAEGGRALSEALGGLALEDPVIVGVARGGVAVAAEVARALDAPLTAVDVERVTAGGRRVGSTTAAGPAYVMAPTADLARSIERAQNVAAMLDSRLDAPAISLAGRVALVVDDGVVTGVTLAAACRWARSRGPSRTIAATPVAHPDGLARLRGEADAVVCPHELDQLAVVGQAYDCFEPLDEWYLAGLLEG